MKHKGIILITTILIAGFTACQKADTTPAQPDKLNVAISSPTNGEMFKKGDIVNIKADVSYITQLHGYVLEIWDKSSGKLLYETEEHVHSDKIAIDEQWTDTIDNNTDLMLKLTTIIVHDENEVTDSVAFKSQP